MAYTTDKTWVAGSVVLASDLQTYVSNNLKWLSTDKPMANIYQNVKQSITASSATQMTYDSTRFDNAGMKTTTARLTVPASSAGKYLIGAYTLMPGQATPGNYHATSIRHLGVTTVSAGQVQVLNSASLGPGISQSGLWNPAVADWFDTVYTQDGGGALSFLQAYFWALWVGI